MTLVNDVKLIALLSILEEKDVITKEEIRDVRRSGRVVPFLVGKGLLTLEEYEDRVEQVREVLDISGNLLKGHSQHPTVMQVLETHRGTFPKLIEFLREELREQERKQIVHQPLPGCSRGG